MEIGEAGKARENFSLGRDFDSSYSNNIRGITLTYFPNIIRRGVNGVSRRLKAFNDGVSVELSPGDKTMSIDLSKVNTL